VGELGPGRVADPIDDDDVETLAGRGQARGGRAGRGERDDGGQNNREQGNEADRPDHQLCILTDVR
jgi:hypothetical protein